MSDLRDYVRGIVLEVLKECNFNDRLEALEKQTSPKQSRTRESVFERRKSILAYLLERDSATAVHIAEDTNNRESDIRNDLYYLQNEGLVKQCENRSLWSLC